MIKPISAPSNRCDRTPGSNGFTLVELLVVIGIIVLLAGILLPMASRAYAKAERARVAAELNAISMALEAYKQDHGAYPDPGPNNNGTNDAFRGAHCLLRALIAPGPIDLDGADGLGFRVRPGGKVWNPYLPADQFKVGDMNGTPVAVIDSTTYPRMFILDRFKKPILYFRAVGTTNDIKSANGFVAKMALSTPTIHPMYDSSQNSAFLAEDRLRMMLGDTTSGTPIGPLAALTPNGRIDGDEAPTYTGPYILWSSGPDEKFGAVADDAGNSTALDKADLDKCDDITNFRS